MPLEAVPTLQSIAKGIDLLHQISDLAKRFEPNYYKFIQSDVICTIFTNHNSNTSKSHIY